MNSMDIDEGYVYKRALVEAKRYSLKDEESGKIVKQCNEEFKYGDVPALLQVGLCHANGTDLPKDDAKAAEFFCKAAEQGLANAQCCLAECYYNGFGVKQDYAEAAKWFRLDEIPQLAFDHDRILRYAIFVLRERIHFRPIGFDLLPEKFTMKELQSLYEVILDVKFDRSNFAKKMNSLNVLTLLDETVWPTAKREAHLYRFNEESYNEMKQKGFRLEF